MYSIPLSSSGYVRSHEKALRLIRRLRIYFQSCYSRKHCLRTLTCRSHLAVYLLMNLFVGALRFYTPWVLSTTVTRIAVWVLSAANVLPGKHTGTSSTVILITAGPKTHHGGPHGTASEGLHG